jgi:hypothetical protein
MKLKAFKALIVVTLFLSVFLCFSLVSALESNEATVSVQWSNPSPRLGESAILTFTFQSNVQEQLQIAAIGIHGDWMPTDSFAGPIYTSNPITIPSKGSHTFDPYKISFPITTTPGTYSYFIGVDGYDSSGKPFSLDSQKYSITISYPSTSTSTPSPSPTSSGSQNGSNDNNLLTIIIAVTVIAVIAVIFVALFMSRRRGQPTPASSPQSFDSQPLPPAPEEEETSETQQNFDI